MEWGKLLALERLKDPNYIPQKHRPAYMQDADRIVFSPPFRRLANKTQVHPLYDNDHVHQRLIHSLEVATVGRSLGIGVGAWLADELQEIESDKVDVIAGLVQTACMAHDIGNPPFGHSGEAAIGSWFARAFDHAGGALADITPAQRVEFEAFEGNAQGFRILTRTEMYRDDGGMRLTFGALGAFTKYPVSASVKALIGETGNVDGRRYIGIKKFGFFENDVRTFDEVASSVGLLRNNVKDGEGAVVGHWWRRHPLVYLVEAADDICYNIMDLEDAYLSGDIEAQRVIALLERLITKSNKEYPQQDNVNTVSRYRALAIRDAISSCVEAFKDNYPAIMRGELSVSLVDVCHVAAPFKEIKDISRKEIFSARRKTELEVFGRNVIHRTLDGLMPLLEELRFREWDASKLSGYHTQLARALQLPLAGVSNTYDGLHALTDFVSGMTDRYAVKVSEMISPR